MTRLEEITTRVEAAKKGDDWKSECRGCGPEPHTHVVECLDIQRLERGALAIMTLRTHALSDLEWLLGVIHMCDGCGGKVWMVGNVGGDSPMRCMNCLLTEVRNLRKMVDAGAPEMVKQAVKDALRELFKADGR